MILLSMGNTLIDMSFFKKYSVTLDLANNVVKFPDITLQLKPERGRYKIQKIKLRTSQKTVIPPDHSEKGPGHFSGLSRKKDTTTGVPSTTPNLRNEKPCFSNRTNKPHCYTKPKYHSGYPQNPDPEPSEKPTNDVKRATYPHHRVPSALNAFTE